jgi:hypothetical protein
MILFHRITVQVPVFRVAQRTAFYKMPLPIMSGTSGEIDTKHDCDSFDWITRCQAYIAQNHACIDLLHTGRFSEAGRLYQETLHHVRHDLHLVSSTILSPSYQQEDLANFGMKKLNITAHLKSRRSVSLTVEGSTRYVSPVTEPPNGFVLCDCFVVLNWERIECNKDQPCINVEKVLSTISVATLYNLAMSCVWLSDAKLTHGSCDLSQRSSHLHRAQLMFRKLHIILHHHCAVDDIFDEEMKSRLVVVTLNNVGYIHAINCQFDHVNECLRNMAEHIVHESWKNAIVATMHRNWHTNDHDKEDNVSLDVTMNKWMMEALMNIHLLYHTSTVCAPTA